MAKKIKWNKPKWMLTPDEIYKVQEELKNIKIMCDQMQKTCYHNTVNRDLEYENIFSSVEKLYTTARIGDCAEHNKDRHEREKKKVKEIYG